MLSRRTFLAGAAGSAVAGAAAEAGATGPTAPGTAFVGCAANQAGQFVAVGIDAAGRRLFRRALPGRGHGLALHPSGGDCVVFARRPGTFAMVLDLATGAVHCRIESARGRHFCGHGTFSSDGRRLFASENDYAARRGVLGIYDALDGYRRIAEVPSHGIGPHELRRMPDKRTLVVANGGIRTHPDFGRAKLNIPTMAPNLAYLDAETGRLRDAVRLPERLHKLSIRHLDVTPQGRVAIAMQYQGDRRDRVPLVGLHDGGGEIRLLHAPAPIERRMRHYTGSVAFDAGGSILAVSSPRGHVLTLWNAERGAYLGHLETADASGLAPAGPAGAFLVTAGDGIVRIVETHAGAPRVRRAAAYDMQWDNHLRRAG